jgi:hypothetical protein
MAKAQADAAQSKVQLQQEQLRFNQEQARLNAQRDAAQLHAYRDIATVFANVLPVIFGQRPQAAPAPAAGVRAPPILPHGWQAHWSNSQQRWWYQPPNSG